MSTNTNTNPAPSHVPSAMDNPSKKQVSGRPAIALSPSISVDVRRTLQQIGKVAYDAQESASKNAHAITGKLGNDPDSLRAASRTIRDNLQSNGAFPLSISQLTGVAAQKQNSFGGIVVFGVLGALPATLGVADTGYVFNATDVGHSFVWDGTQWSFTPGDAGAGYGTFANTSPVPSALWTSVGVGGGNADITQSDGSVVTTAFSAYIAPGIGYTLFVRI